MLFFFYKLVKIAHKIPILFLSVFFDFHFIYGFKQGKMNLPKLSWVTSQS